MNFSNFSDSPGIDFARALVARALTDTAQDATNLAAQLWGSRSAAAAVCRTGVSGVGRDDFSSTDNTFEAAAQARAEFLALAADLTILGRLQGLRRVPTDAAIMPVTAGTEGHWVAEGHAIPASRATITPARLPPRNVGALLVVSAEALRAPNAPELLRRDLARALARATDRAFLSFGTGPNDVIPPGIGHAWPEIASTGDVEADLLAAIDAYGGDFGAAAWAMSPKTAARIALALHGRGLAADLGLRGGTLLGAPVYTSTCEDDTTDGGPAIHLLDASAVFLTDDGGDVATSTGGMVELNDAPTGDTLTPTSGSATRVPLFQTESVAFRAVRHVNFLAAESRPGVVITSTTYGASA